MFLSDPIRTGAPAVCEQQPTGRLSGVQGTYAYPVAHPLRSLALHLPGSFLSMARLSPACTGEVYLQNSDWEHLLCSNAFLASVTKI